MAVDAKTIKSADLVKVREIDFASQFGYSVKKLVEALGITRKIAKEAGATLKIYKVDGTLESGVVGEGEVIPLSKFNTIETPIADITLKKWRKKTTAEAIIQKGYSQAVNDTSTKMMQKIQTGIRKEFFDFLATGTGTATGTTLQATLAQTWGQLQTLFENDTIQAVHFMNVLDVADYLATAQITLQTAFGMSYVENFLGLGTVFFNSSVPKGKVYSTAKDNVVLYYIPVNGADLGEVFTFTADDTGLVGVHNDVDYTDLTTDTVAISGIKLFADYLDGVVIGTIGSAPGGA